MEALLAVAIGKSTGLFTPAPAFFRRSLLKKRVAQILQEKTMTTRRLMISLGASAVRTDVCRRAGGARVSASCAGSAAFGWQ